MATVTSITVEEGLGRLTDLRFSSKKPLGKKEHGMKVSWIKLGNKKAVFDIGVSPIKNPESRELITTEWGVTVYVSQEERQRREAAAVMGYARPPGTPGYPTGGNTFPQWKAPQNWNPAMTGGVPPPGSSMPAQPQPTDEANTVEDDESQLPNRRNFDIVLQYGSKGKELVEQFEQRVKDVAMERCKEWFNKDKMSEETFESLFTSSIRKQEEEQTISLLTKVAMNFFDVFTYNKKTKQVLPCDYKEIKKNIHFQATIVPEYIWFQSSGRCGIRWNTQSVLVYANSEAPAFNFHMEDEHTFPAVADEAEHDCETEQEVEEGEVTSVTSRKRLRSTDAPDEEHRPQPPRPSALSSPHAPPDDGHCAVIPGADAVAQM
jgi:hypothetical protein